MGTFSNDTRCWARAGLSFSPQRPHARSNVVTATLFAREHALRGKIPAPSSRPPGRVEDWRVDYRVRWLFRRFRFGPQSGSLITFPVPALRTGRAVFPHLGLSSGIMPLAHRSPARSRGRLPWDWHPSPTPSTSARGLPPGLLTPRRRRPHQTTPSLWHVMLPESPVLLPGFQAFATPETLPPSVTAPHLRPLPSTSVTRLLQYYEPLRHPVGPDCPSRGPGSVRASPPTGLPVLPPSSPSMRASVTTPAGPKGCPRRSLPPPSSAFPISQVGRPPALPVFEACSTFTRVPARMFAEPPYAAL